MAHAVTALLPSIAALPPTTVRQLGSSNVLQDPSSVVKELIDNALDARTNAIFVDISANTLDSIQIKDTGHGISAEDRPLVCRRYCTSKIRDFRDLEEIGGKWLGFRGEAMASMAEMSGTVEVITRVEVESVAARLKYGRDGELTSTEHASAPVGTTVKVTNFLQTLPVRRETALKESAKTLAKIKRLMQSYAFARPSVRFSLRVLKAKSNKGDFTYAPKKDGNAEDAALKIIGKDSALQCDWTAIESDGFEIHAFLPKPDATGAKIANVGAFLSVDGRPISNSRGTPKKITAVFRERIRKANASCRPVKDPFLCMNIMCPPGSYDSNIEPAKDDVLFEREDVILSVVKKLFMAYYPEAVAVSDVDDDPTPSPSAQPTICTYAESMTSRPDTSFSILVEATVVHPKRPETAFSILEEAAPNEVSIPNIEARTTVGSPPRWRSTMYGIDEDDLELLDSENQPPVIEEEEDERRAANVSNPWAIARMNATVKPKQMIRNNQLMTPAKGSGDITMGSSSPVPATNTRRRLPLEPLTPETSSKLNARQSSRDAVVQQSVEGASQKPRLGFPAIEQENGDIGRLSVTRKAKTTIVHDLSPSSSPFPRRSGRYQKPPNDQRSLHAFEGRPGGNDWFGKPMRGQAPSRFSRPRRQKQAQDLDIPMFDSDSPSDPLTSENNSDIRDFLWRNRPQLQERNPSDPIPGPSSFTPINRPFRSPRILDTERSTQHRGSRSTAYGCMSRALSAEPPRRPRHGRNPPPYNSDGLEPSDFAGQLRAHAERGDAVRSPAKASSLDSNSMPITAHAAAHPSSPAEQPRLPTARPETSAQEMAAMFAAYSDLPDAPARKLRSTKASHTSIVHEAPIDAHPQHRRRTTNGLQRTKSAHLALERVPHEYCIHNVVLQIHAPTTRIAQAMLKLDMQRNSVEWAYPANPSAYDAFSARVTVGRLRAWVLRIDGMLEGFDTGTDREGILGTLEWSIKEALRKQGSGGEVAVEPGWFGATGASSVEGCMDGMAGDQSTPSTWKKSAGLPPPTSPAFADPQTENTACLVQGPSDEFGGADLDDEAMLMDF